MTRIVVRNRWPRLTEIPFDSDRKMMSTVHKLAGGLMMVTKGAADVLLDRCVVTPEERARIEQVNEQFSNEGLRVLAFACRSVDSPAITLADENGLTFLGLIAMMDPPREESKAAVAECIRAGIRPIMITGDHKITAAAIAREIGILRDGTEAVEGAVIDGMSDEELQEFVPKVSVYARVSPEHKIRIVRAWQQRGNLVAMTGDGVNDAPALKQADIGVAMGITGTEVAKDAAGMVLTDDNFATIVKAVKNGRNVYANIKRAIQFLLSGNTGGHFDGALRLSDGTARPLRGSAPAVHQPADGLSARHRPWHGATHRRGHVGKAPAPERGHPDKALPLQRGRRGTGHRRRHRHGLLSGAEHRRCRCWTDHGLLHPVPEPTVPRI